MGLDWNPGPKPKPGFEQEFRELFEKVEAKSESADDTPNGSVLGKTLGAFGLGRRQAGSSVRTLKEAMLARLEEVSTSPFETLEAPQVGHHPEADEWARKRFARQSANMSLQRWMERMKGYYVLDAVPPCDGLPLYTNGQPGGYVEAFSFRADFLRDCEDIIGVEMLGDAYESKLSDALVEFGGALLRKAEEYAQENGIDLEAIDGERLLDDAAERAREAAGDDAVTELGPYLLSVDNFKLDVIRAAARWCIFWGERGHLMEAYW